MDIKLWMVCYFFYVLLPSMCESKNSKSHRSSPPKHVCDEDRCSGKYGPTLIGRVQGLYRLNGVKVRCNLCVVYFHLINSKLNNVH